MSDTFAPTSTASETAPASSGGDVLASMSSEARSHWRLTGELPTHEPASTDGADDALDVTPDSSPATPVDQAAEVAASPPPASKPGTPSKKSNAETRKAELNAEIQELLSRRDRLRAESEQRTYPPPPDVRPDSPPAAPDLAQTLHSPNIHAPRLSEETFWQQFPNATVGDYASYVTRYELRADAALRDDYAARKSRTDPYFDQLEKRKQDDPGFLDRIDTRVKSLVPVDLLPPGTRPNAGNIIAQAVVTSPQALALMEHLSAHPEIVDRLQSARDTETIVREIGRLEATLERSKTATPAAPAALPVSLAPPPPATLGSKPAQPADELQEAIRTGDFARYRELQNRKEMKRA